MPMRDEETTLREGNVIETKNKLMEVEANLSPSEYDGKLETVFEPMSEEDSDLSEVPVNQAKNNSLKEETGPRPVHSYQTNKKEAVENTVKKCNVCEFTAKSA